MSTPLTLQRDASVTIDTVQTRRGVRAALRVRPEQARGSVVLVPGFTGSKEDFLTLLPLLGAAGWHVLAYDHLGQYQSPGTDVGADYSIDLLAADLLDIVATMPSREVIAPITAASGTGSFLGIWIEPFSAASDV